MCSIMRLFLFVLNQEARKAGITDGRGKEEVRYETFDVRTFEV
jgi:hypothetical protein